MRANTNGQRQPIDLGYAQVPRGRVFVISERCKGCDYCIRFCPQDVLSESKEINAKGYHYPIVEAGKDELCIHCRFCDLVCPEMAIYTEEVEAPAESEGASSEHDNG